MYTHNYTMYIYIYIYTSIHVYYINIYIYIYIERERDIIFIQHETTAETGDSERARTCTRFDVHGGAISNEQASEQ